MKMIRCDVFGCKAEIAVYREEVPGWTTVAAMYSGVEKPLLRHVCPDCLGKFNQVFYGAVPCDDGDQVRARQEPRPTEEVQLGIVHLIWKGYAACGADVAQHPAWWNTDLAVVTCEKCRKEHPRLEAELKELQACEEMARGPGLEALEKKAGEGAMSGTRQEPRPTEAEECRAMDEVMRRGYMKPD